MARRPAVFRQTDVTRAIQGARAAGETVRQVEIDATGKIIVIVGVAVGQVGQEPSETGESWDGVS